MFCLQAPARTFLLVLCRGAQVVAQFEQPFSMLSSGSDTGFYLVVFGALAMACAGVVYAQNRGTSSDTTTDDFKKFQRSFLAVYFLASLSDWLQVRRLCTLQAVAESVDPAPLPLLFHRDRTCMLCMRRTASVRRTSAFW